MTIRSFRARAGALPCVSVLLAAPLALSCAAGGDASAEASAGPSAAATLVRPQAEIDAAWAQAQTISSDMYTSNRTASYAMFHDVPVSTSWWDWTQDSLSFMNGVVPSTTDFESRLGIRELRLLDGPVTCGGSNQGCTIFPAPIAVAASWDVDQAVTMYAAQGAEKKAKGANVSLSPTMNIVRDPRGGRNFETFSEDPYLTAQLAAAAVTGIQSNHIIATSKHYIDNDQETNRNAVIVSVDERTQHEIYLAPFKAAVQAGTGAVMCSYNQIANPAGGQDYGCENAHQLKDLLKGELGFRGFVMSDWNATHSGAKAANNGLDMEMNTTTYFGNLSGQITDATAQEMLRRIVFAHLVSGLSQNPVSKITKAQGVQTRVVSTAANLQIAQQTAEQSIVLLKNAGILPLSKGTTNIAVLGECAESKYIYQGGGSASGDVTGKSIVTPRQAIANALGVPVGNVPYGTESNLGGAASLATGKAAAIVVLCQMSQEDKDRGGINFGATNSNSNANSDSLVTQVAATGTPTIVMTIGPAQVGMPWAGNANVKAILWAGLLGEMEGPAIARVLFGDVNPSGKLPVTFGSLTDFPTQSSVYGNPSDLFPGGSTVYYKEGLNVGYRHFDARSITPLFPFGHGLSYTTFGYANLAVTPSVNAQAGDAVTVELDVTNTGARAGAEVVQVYLGFPSAAGEPPKVLKGFKKVSLAAGAVQHVSITLPPDAYRYWSNGWVPALGTFQVMVGSSSRDVRLTGSFTVSNGTPVNYPVSVTLSGTAGGTVTSTPAGIACGATCTASFAGGSLVTLTAAPASGAVFGGWSGACAAAGAAATCIVTVSSAQSVGATFNLAPQPGIVSVTLAGTGTGRVVSSPAGINCPGTCSASFPVGTLVILTATPGAGSAFGGWGGVCTGTATTCQTSVSASTSVTVSFAAVPTYPLTVTPAGAGSGTVSSTPAGISCGATCSASFAAGTLVTLSASPGASSTFTGWSGACTGATATCTVTMSAAQSVGATFGVGTTPVLLSQGKPATASSVESASYPASYAVDASTTTRWSSQFSDPQWLQVDLGQTASVTQVVLRWEAAYGKAFQLQVSNDATTWTSIYSTTAGTGGTQTLAVSGSGRYVRMYGTARGTAYGYSLYDFQVWGTTGAVVNPTLTVSKLGTGAGTVTSTPAGVSCGTACSASFPAGTLVTLTAAPDAASSSTFGGWGGACSGTAATCVVTLSQSLSVTATFTAGVQTYSLTVAGAGTGAGSVTRSPPGTSCGTGCTSYPAGTIVTLTAVPAAGTTFGGWSGACTGSALTCTVTMSSSLSVTVTWMIVDQPALTVTKTGTGQGTVTSSTGGISCGTVCNAVYPAGTVVTLTAVATSGSAFAGWSGACTGTAATCAVTMSTSQSAGASFNTVPVNTPCANPVTFASQSGNFNTTGAICLRTAAAVNGWGCSNFSGRTVSVNGGTATATCGAGPFPLPKWSDGYTYFSVTAGTYSWASLYTW